MSSKNGLRQKAGDEVHLGQTGMRTDKPQCFGLFPHLKARNVEMPSISLEASVT